MGRQWLHRQRLRRGRHAEAALDAAGALVTSGKAEAARVQQAAIVLGTTLSYGYCPTGRAWRARLVAGRLTWTPAAP